MRDTSRPVFNSEKKEFLYDELFSLTIMATAQRGHLYKASATTLDKTGFRQSLRQTLTELALGYTTPKTDGEHEAHIVSLATVLSRSHSAVLLDGRFRIGSAQKALNLFLKYLWCLGEVDTPPHCPFDYRIIQMLPRAARCNWTMLDSIDAYHTLVSAARQKAEGRSLSEWELEAYNTSFAPNSSRNAKRMAPQPQASGTNCESGAQL